MKYLTVLIMLLTTPITSAASLTIVRTNNLNLTAADVLTVNTQGYNLSGKNLGATLPKAQLAQWKKITTLSQELPSHIPNKNCYSGTFEIIIKDINVAKSNSTTMPTIRKGCMADAKFVEILQTLKKLRLFALKK